MQNVVSDKPYRFRSARHSWFWTALFMRMLPTILRRSWGVEQVELRGMDRLKASLKAGHGIILAPNHCRPCDPPVVAMLTRDLDLHPYALASNHLFLESRINRFVFPRIGVFSLYREGIDREALKFASRVLCETKRPLMLFAEGVVTRTNDRLKSLMEGPAFIARTALKQKDWTPGRRMVVHPVAIRYFYDGPREQLEASLATVVTEIERRLTWVPDSTRPLVDRVERLGMGLLALYEIEHRGAVHEGPLADRLAGVIEAILSPLEAEWLRGRRVEGDVLDRVKALRAVILHGMVQGEVEPAERERRWRQLRALDLAQELSFFPPGYYGETPTAEELLEAVDRIEENITGHARNHGPLRVVVEVCEPIEVPSERVRGTEDPVMIRLRDELQAAITRLRVTGRRPE